MLSSHYTSKRRYHDACVMDMKQKSNLPMAYTVRNGQSRTYSQTWHRNHLLSVFWMWQPDLQTRIDRLDSVMGLEQFPSNLVGGGGGAAVRAPQAFKVRRCPRGACPDISDLKGPHQLFQLSEPRPEGPVKRDWALCFHQWKEREGLLFDWPSFCCFAHVGHGGHTLWSVHD